MSEKDNNLEHGHEPVASPTPEPAPEPTAAPEAPSHVVEPPAADTHSSHEAEVVAPVAAEPVPEENHEAPPAADVAPAHAEPVESSNLPEAGHAPVEAPAAESAESHDVFDSPFEPAPEPATEAVSSAVHEVAPVTVAPEADHGHTEALAPVAAAVEETPVAEPEPAPPAPEPAQTHEGIDPTIAAAGAAAAGVAAGAAAAAASRPIWSDQGDAPFDDGVAARPASTGRGERKRESGGFVAELLDIVRTVIYALLIALVVRVFFFQPFTIPSASMEPNLYEGDYIVVSKWSYGYSRHSMPWSPPLFEGRLLSQAAERGDIVVFKRPNNNGEGYTDYIKRIIGLPGDTVQMIANRLYINGEVVPDVVVPAAEVRGAFQGQTPIRLRETLPGGHEFHIQDFGPGSPSDDTDAFTIPAGHYFVMGDNRDDSMDSRYVWEAGGVGLVPHENLVGKAQIILFSWTPGASLLNPVSWFTNVRAERFFTDLE
jgi:signal peptidase I